MKETHDIYEEMRELFCRETGMTLHPGSEMAIRLYTMATQVYGLYVQNKWTLEQCLGWMSGRFHRPRFRLIFRFN